MKGIRLVLIASVIVMTLVASALPAAAQGFGPSIFCNGGTFEECTDNYYLSSSEEFFGCEGTVGDIASCTNQRTAETSLYCVFMGHEPSEDRDVYLCGPAPEYSE
jgi:hypothetical protein